MVLKKWILGASSTVLLGILSTWIYNSWNFEFSASIFISSLYSFGNVILAFLLMKIAIWHLLLIFSSISVLWFGWNQLLKNKIPPIPEKL